MKYTAYSFLSPEQQERIRTFLSYCNSCDHLYNEMYLGSEYSFYPEMHHFYLAEDDSGIAGFLMVYADEPDGAEISACVLPTRRRQGIFSTLFEYAQQELKRFHYSKIFLKTEKAFPARKEFLSRYPAVYSHSEYLMVCDDSADCRPCAPGGDFSLRPAEKEDLEALAAIQAAAFDNPPDVAGTYVRETFYGEKTSLYAAFLRDTPVGCVSVDQSGPFQYLFGLCIAPAFQHQGLGRKMLAGLLELLRRDNSREIALGVDRDNLAALPLYQSCGFSQRSETQYYVMNL